MHQNKTINLRIVGRWLKISIILSGISLPWIVGIGVKIYLDTQGQPTYPWTYFLELRHTIGLLLAAIWQGALYIGIGIGANILMKRTRPWWGFRTLTGKLLFICGGVVGAYIGTVVWFIDVFWKFEPFWLIIPVWPFYLPYVLAGFLVGFLSGRLADRGWLRVSEPTSKVSGPM